MFKVYWKYFSDKMLSVYDNWYTWIAILMVFPITITGIIGNGNLYAICCQLIMLAIQIVCGIIGIRK